MSGPVFMEELSAKFIGTLKGMCAEIVTLSLNHISRELRRYQRIEIVQCGRESRNRQFLFHRMGYKVLPTGKQLFDFFPEIRSE